MKTIQFIIPHRPVALPRPKASLVLPSIARFTQAMQSAKRWKEKWRWVLQNSVLQIYTPSRTATGKSNGVREFRTAAKLAAAHAFSADPVTGPVRIDAVFVLARHQAKVWKTKPMPRYWHVTKPDRDNLMKLLLDSLTGVIWHDDNQVCCGEAMAVHAQGDEETCVAVRIQEISDVCVLPRWADSLLAQQNEEQQLIPF